MISCAEQIHLQVGDEHIQRSVEIDNIWSSRSVYASVLSDFSDVPFGFAIHGMEVKESRQMEEKISVLSASGELPELISSEKVQATKAGPHLLCRRVRPCLSVTLKELTQVGA